MALRGYLGVVTQKVPLTGVLYEFALSRIPFGERIRSTIVEPAFDAIDQRVTPIIKRVEGKCEDLSKAFAGLSSKTTEFTNKAVEMIPSSIRSSVSQRHKDIRAFLDFDKDGRISTSDLYSSGAEAFQHIKENSKKAALEKKEKALAKVNLYITKLNSSLDEFKANHQESIQKVVVLVQLIATTSKKYVDAVASLLPATFPFKSLPPSPKTAPIDLKSSKSAPLLENFSLGSIQRELVWVRSRVSQVLTRVRFLSVQSRSACKEGTELSEPAAKKQEEQPTLKEEEQQPQQQQKQEEECKQQD